MTSGYSGTKRLLEKRPEWHSVIEESLEASKKYKEFAGRWVLESLREKKKDYPIGPGLKTLSAFEILKRTDTSRGGRRAYYVMPDPSGVEKALREAGYLK